MFPHLIAAVEFIEKMDKALKIDEESYETFMEATIAELNSVWISPLANENETVTGIWFNEKLDIARRKLKNSLQKQRKL